MKGSNSPKEIELITAVYEKNINVVESLIREGIDINTKVLDKKIGTIFFNYYSNSILHLAVRMQSVEIAELLIKRGADINLKDAHGCQPIYHAVNTNNTKLVKLLIDNGATICSDNAAELLNTMLKNNAYESMALLFEHGMQKYVNIVIEKITKLTSLHYAVFKYDNRYTQLLLDNGANPNCRTRSGITPIFYAAQSCFKSGDDKIEMLLEYGANPLITSKKGMIVFDITNEGRQKIIFDYLFQKSKTTNAAINK